MPHDPAHTPHAAKRQPPGHGDSPVADVQPWRSGLLAVCDGHHLYYEQCGDPAGVPVVVLHGGPGSGCSPRMRTLLDSGRFQLVLFDQRGCGRSTPRGRCEANHTDALVDDIERLRLHLGIPGWLVFGGSWGASLAVAYCARHRHACLGAILRGVFLAGRADIERFFNGVAGTAPQAWQALAALAPASERDTLARWYCDTVLGDDAALALAAVARWAAWEHALMQSAAAPAADTPRADTPTDTPALHARLDKYRVQAHYLRNECFIGEARLLQAAATIEALPVAIVHGREDRICRPENAVRLAAALPGARLQLVDKAGHSPFEPAMHAALLAAGRHFLENGGFEGWPAAAHDTAAALS